MEKKVIFVFGLILTISFVLAIGSSPHTFYGSIQYNNQAIPNGCIITAKTSDFAKDCLTQDGSYGYKPNLCVVESYSEGDLVEFYLNNVKIGEYNFEEFGKTKLDFTLDSAPECPTEYCGDGICNNGETCETCETDCGTCSTTPPENNNDGTSSGGGRSSGNGGDNEDNNNNIFISSKDTENEGESSSFCVERWACQSWSNKDDLCGTRICRDINKCGTTELKPKTYKDCPTTGIFGMTGAFAGAVKDLAKSGAGMSLIFAILIIIIGIIVTATTKSRQRISPAEKPEEKKEK